LLVLSTSVSAQQSTRKKETPPADVPASRNAGFSELAKENYEQIAASAFDIKQALLGNPGMKVELRRLIAKEASDNGQVVNEKDLTDQAIDERLESDIEFRAATTRLLQRYGYLMPKVNPESDEGKEQDLVLKERARRLVQIESQEDQNSLQSKPMERTAERNARCDEAEGSDCNTRVPGQQRRNIAAPREQNAPERASEERAPGPRECRTGI
jgi:hypothetical protein